MSRFDYIGKCPVCGAGSECGGDTGQLTEKICCWGCGYFYNGIKINNSNVDPSISIEFKQQNFGVCITKDNMYIVFKNKPLDSRIEELKDKSTLLCVWDDNKKVLNKIIGDPTEEFVRQNQHEEYEFLTE